jgi:hypothetical protein
MDPETVRQLREVTGCHEQEAKTLLRVRPSTRVNRQRHGGNLELALNDFYEGGSRGNARESGDADQLRDP